jgi:hypothetical protein
MKKQVEYLQRVFYDLLNDYGQVYILVKYSENSVIGNRGFSEEEKKQGIILTFNQENYKHLNWIEGGSIMASLGFGTNNRPEKCFLHYDDIVSVFSPSAKVRIDRWDMWDVAGRGGESKKPAIPGSEPPGAEKIVSMDRFRKTKSSS